MMTQMFRDNVRLAPAGLFQFLAGATAVLGVAKWFRGAGDGADTPAGRRGGGGLVGRLFEGFGAIGTLASYHSRGRACPEGSDLVLPDLYKPLGYLLQVILATTIGVRRKIGDSPKENVTGDPPQK